MAPLFRPGQGAVLIPIDRSFASPPRLDRTPTLRQLRPPSSRREDTEILARHRTPLHDGASRPCARPTRLPKPRRERRRRRPPRAPRRTPHARRPRPTHTVVMHPRLRFASASNAASSLRHPTKLRPAAGGAYAAFGKVSPWRPASSRRALHRVGRGQPIDARLPPLAPAPDARDGLGVVRGFQDGSNSMILEAPVSVSPTPPARNARQSRKKSSVPFNRDWASCRASTR